VIGDKGYVSLLPKNSLAKNGIGLVTKHRNGNDIRSDGWFVNVIDGKFFDTNDVDCVFPSVDSYFLDIIYKTYQI
jgi:hypothetical protein